MNVAVRRVVGTGQDGPRVAKRGAAATALRSSDCEVAVIGAGPYGLSISAHLKGAGIEDLTFGEPLAFWRRNMPKGMKLRSPWRGSHLSDPAGALTLDAFARERGLERVEPLPLETFIDYGCWFQGRAVPEVDHRHVVRLERVATGFRLTLADGEAVAARRVVVALGLANQECRPPEFAGLPADVASHSCDEADPARFAGRRIAVIGRGQSACETAVLLTEAGAEVDLISRGPVRWIGSETPEAPQGAGLVWRAHKLLSPANPTGPFPLNWLTTMPALVRLLPRRQQDALAARCLRAAASAWLLPRAHGLVMRPNCRVVEARADGRGVTLSLSDGERLTVDHVLMATGYRTDIARLGLLGPDVLQAVKTMNGAPVLRRGYESSLPGLHFAGASAMASFGPQMRFVWGAGFTARALVRRIAGRGR